MSQAAARPSQSKENHVRSGAAAGGAQLPTLLPGAPPTSNHPLTTNGGARGTRPTDTDDSPADSGDQLIGEHLEAVRAALWRSALLKNVLLLCGAVVSAGLLFVVLDQWVYNLNWPLRLIWAAAMIAGSIFFAWQRIIPLLRLRISREYAAYSVELDEPELYHSLTSYVTLRDQRDTPGLRGVVVRSIGVRAARHLRAAGMSMPTETLGTFKPGLFASFACAAFILYAVLSPKDTVQTVSRLAAPLANIVPPSRVKIHEVLPGDTDSLYGRPVTISAKIEGLSSSDRPVINTSSNTDTAGNSSFPLTASDSPQTFTAILPGDVIRQDLQYVVVAGDARSEAYIITVRDEPTVNVDQVQYSPPAYTKRPKRSSSSGAINGLEGTLVTVTATTNRKVVRGRIEFNPREINGTTTPTAGFAPLEISDDGRSVYASWNLRAGKRSGAQVAIDSYRLRVWDETESINSDPIEYPIQVTADLAPEIRITVPATWPKDVPLGTQQLIEVRAADPDFGLTRVELRIRRGQRHLATKPLLVDESGAVGPQSLLFRFRPDQFNLMSDDRVTIEAVAYDNRISAIDQTPDPNIVASDPVELRIVQPAAANDPVEDGDGLQPKTTESESGKSKSQDDSGSQKGQSGDQQQQGGGGAGDSQGQPSEDGRSDRSQAGGSEASGSESKNSESKKSESNNSNQQGTGSASQDQPSESPSNADSNGGSGNGAIGENATQNTDGQNSSPQENQSPPSNSESDGDSQSDSTSSENGSAKTSTTSGQSNNDGNGAEPSNPSDPSNSSANDPSENSTSSPDSQPASGGDNASSESDANPGNGPEGSANRKVGNGAGQGSTGKSRSAPATNDGEAMERMRDYFKEKQQESQSQDSPATKDPSQAQQSSANQSPSQPTSEGGNQASSNDPSADAQPEESASTQEQDSTTTQSPKPDSKNPDSKQAGASQSTKSESPQSNGESSENQDSDAKPPSGSDTPSSNEQAKESENNRNSGSEAVPKNQNDTSGSPESQPSKSTETKSTSDGSTPVSQPNASGKGGSEAPGSPQATGTTPEKSDSASESKDTQTSSNGQQPPATGSDASKTATGDPTQPDSVESDSVESDPAQSPPGTNEQSAPNLNNQSQSASDRQSNKPTSNKEGGQNGPGPENQDAGNSPATDNQKNSGSTTETKSGKSSANQPGKTADSSKDQATSSSTSDQRQSGDQSDQSPPNSATGEGTSGSGSTASPSNQPGRPNRSGNAGAQTPPAPDPVDLEAAKETTDLVLDALESQRENPDPELLDRLGWSSDQLKRFVDRWQKTRRLADSPDAGSRKEFEDSLKSLGIRPPTTTGPRESVGADDALRDVQNSGSRVEPPPQFRDRLDAVRRLLNKQ